MECTSYRTKVKFQLKVDAALGPKQVEEVLLANENTAQFLDGKAPRKIIVVPGRIINVVV